MVCQHYALHFLVGVDIVNAECLMTNGMAKTEQFQNRARMTIAARGAREMVVVVVVVVYTAVITRTCDL